MQDFCIGLFLMSRVSVLTNVSTLYCGQLSFAGGKIRRFLKLAILPVFLFDASCTFWQKHNFINEYNLYVRWPILVFLYKTTNTINPLTPTNVCIQYIYQQFSCLYMHAYVLSLLASHTDV